MLSYAIYLTGACHSPPPYTTHGPTPSFGHFVCLQFGNIEIITQNSNNPKIKFTGQTKPPISSINSALKTGFPLIFFGEEECGIQVAIVSML